jgi:hypothetical protein
VWISARPESSMQCAVCMDRLIRQIADVQAHQAPMD